MLDETVTMHGYVYVRPEHAPFCFDNLMVSISYRLASYQKKTAWSGQKREMLIRRLSLCLEGPRAILELNDSTMASFWLQA